MKKWYVIGLILGMTLGASEVRGQAAGAFARLGFGARGMAMSNALVADVYGDVSPYYNPALAPFIAGQSVEVSAAFMSVDRELQFIQLAAPLKPRAGIAAGLIHAGVSGIDGRDGSGFHTRTLSTDEFGFFLAFGVRTGERLTAGVGLQFFRSDLLDEVSAVNSIGLDVGFTLRVTDALRLGLAFDDLLARYSWDTSDAFGSSGRSTSDRFPVRIRLGGAYQLYQEQLLITAEYESRFTSSEVRTRSVRLVGNTPTQVLDAERLTLQESRFRIGVEYRPMDVFAIRTGVDRFGSQALGGVRPSGGFMVEQPLGNLVARAEYAVVLEPFALGTMHLITLRIYL